MKRVTSLGKQVLLDGRHLADARDERTATVIAICLNRAGPANMSATENARCRELFE